MKLLNYSAGAVSKGFWFEEFKKYMNLLEEGYTFKEIKELQETENIFLAPSKDYGIKLIGEISKRIKALPIEIRTIFFDLNASDQKIVNFIGVLMTDILFFEYMYESYRQEVILGTKEFEDSNTRIFLNNKSEQSERVAKYTEQTKKRLAGAYKTYLRESNLIGEENGILIYKKPLLDIRLENEMKNPTIYPYFKALMGVD